MISTGLRPFFKGAIGISRGTGLEKYINSAFEFFDFYVPHCYNLVLSDFFLLVLHQSIEP